MYKKFLCVILSVAMILSMVTLPDLPLVRRI